MGKGRTSPRRLGRVAAIIAAVAALGIAVAMWPRQWRLANNDGSTLCTVSKGWSVSDVTRACGVPLQTGDQPKVPRGWMSFCSAPCELRGSNLIFYDCGGKVAAVERVAPEWQGCMLRIKPSPSND